MTNAEKILLKSICWSSANKAMAQKMMLSHFLTVSKSTFNKYWKIFGGKGV